MNIDRTRFLVLTGALAAVATAGACTITSTSNNTDAGASNPDGGSTFDGTLPDAGDRPDSGGDAAKEAAVSCDDNSDTDAGGYDCTRFDAPEDGGTGTGCIGDPGASSVCGAAVELVKPKTASRALDCMAAATTCDTTSIETCFAGALAKACPDTTAAAPCQEIASSCSDAGADAGVSTQECTQLLSGLTQTGRDNVVACVVGNDCLSTVRECVGNIYSAGE